MDSELAERLGVAKGCAIALDAMKQYLQNSLETITEVEQDFLSLPNQQRNLVPTFQPRYKQIRECVQQNAKVLREILSFHRTSLQARLPELRKRKTSTTNTTQNEDEEDEYSHDCCGGGGHKQGEPVSWEHRAMVENMFMQFYREWSSIGESERQECYFPAINLAKKLLPPSKTKTNVLVPGAGFCRMPWELALLGYNVEACEPSHSMILSAQFILGNGCCCCSSCCCCTETTDSKQQPQTRTVFPFVHTSANIQSAEEMTFLRAEFPDKPIDMNIVRERFTLTGNDFVTLARKSPRGGCKDMIVTCFFIDTAFNILDYIESSATILKPGGLWINIGPLHWVHSIRESLRLTMEEIKSAMVKVGFEFIEYQVLHNCHYCSPPTSLMPMVFDCVLWAAKISQ